MSFYGYLSFESTKTINWCSRRLLHHHVQRPYSELSMKFMTLTPVQLFHYYCHYFFFQKFLNEYGYVSFSRSGNHDVSTAIRMFQEYFGLRVSGILDASTVNLMKKPRCGVPDANEGVRMQRYATLGKWSKKNLNYFVQPGQDLPHVSYKRIGLFYFILFYFNLPQ